MSNAARIDALVASMTLAEKLGQLAMRTGGMAETGPVAPEDLVAGVRAGAVGSVLNLRGRETVAALQRVAVEETRLGLPLFFALDVLHGHRTIFPSPLGEASAFDPALWRRTARAAAREAAADGVDLTFAPMLDVCRDPRWGRIVEGPGEDPWTAARVAEAKVAGFQGARLDDPTRVAATAKHLGGYGFVTAGRDYASVDLSDRTLDEVCWPPFRAAVAAGVAAVMPAFVDLAGVPATAHAGLLRDRLRGRWGFGGVVVSDYGAIAELVAHGVAADLAEAAALALGAGVDIDMMGDAYRLGLPEALARGLVGIEAVDAAARRVLALKAALGLLDDPFRRLRARRRPAPARALAREAGRRAAVLLKNDGALLPLGAGARRIAVIGPIAAAREEMLGPWSAAGDAARARTILAGLRDALPGRAVLHEPGVALGGAADDSAGIAAAAEAARGADVVLLCLGESRWMSGEAASRGRPDLPGAQAALAEAALAAGAPVALILSAGRPLTIAPLLARVGAALMVWHPGSEGGDAVADIVTGRAAPTGRLPVSWPVETGQIPVFFGARPTGRPPSAERFTAKYLDLPVAPLFPFGHGLGWGAADWLGLRARPARVRRGRGVTVEIALGNPGAAPVEETAFVFLRRRVGPVAPAMRLAGVARARLPPGATRALRLRLDPAAFAEPGPDGEPAVLPGLVDVLAGPSADPARLLRATVALD